MKTQLTGLIVGITMLTLAGAVHAATWQGGATGDWTGTGDNWGLGAGAYPGDASNSGEGVTIDGGSTVTLGTNLTNPIGVWSAGNFTLNLSADMSIGAAYHGNWKEFTINQSGGTVTSDSRFDIGGSTGSAGTSYQSYYNLSGGVLDLNNTDFRFGYTTASSNRGYLNVSKTETTAGDLYFVNAAVGYATLNVTGGTVTGTGTFNMDNTDGATPEIHISGSDATSVSFGTLDAFNASGQTSLRFTLDSSGQVTKIDVGTLNLNGTVNADLIVDASALARGTSVSALTLFDYDTLNSTGFNSIQVLGDGVSYSDLTYNYDLGSGDLAIALEGLTAIPEPATGFLMLLGGLVFLRRRRR